MTLLRPLERRLLIVVVAALLPVVIVSYVTVELLARQQDAEIEQSTIQRVRAMGAAVDTELARLVSVLETLGTNAALDSGDLVAFRAAAVRVKEGDTSWANIVLQDPTSRQVMNLLRPVGAPLPQKALWPEIFHEALRARRPFIGPLVPRGPIITEPVFTIDVPIDRDGKLAFVLTGIVRPAAMRTLVGKQEVPSDAVVSILDTQGQHIARSRAHDEWLGKPASERLRHLMARGAEGWGPSATLEGQPTYAAFSRSSVTGWTVAVGIRREAIDGPVMRSRTVLGLSVAVSLTLGLVAALLAARSVSRPVRALRDAAQTLGRGEPPLAPRTAVPEIREVGEALTAAHAERERLLEAERRARTDAETASRAKDEFLAMLSHELRNPLNVIAGAISILDKIGKPDEPAARTRQLVQRQVRHLADLLDDLLDVARVTSGKIILHRRPIDLGATVERCLRTYADTGRLVRHRVATTCTSVWIDADETRIEQMAANLIGNAIKYTPAGGDIRVSVDIEGPDAVLRVQDTGAGISRELLPRIFDPFVQGERTIERAAGGLGVGLTLVRRLAELQGGVVSAESDGEGRGTVFTVRLPRISRPVTPVEEKPPAAKSPGGRRVLVVEDNADGRDMLRTILTLQGHEVHEAGDGLDAVTTALEIQPDVAVVDIGLPGIDGYAVAARLRQDPRTSGTRLIALTGYGSDEDRRRAVQVGFDAHITKPVDPDVLARLVDGS